MVTLAHPMDDQLTVVLEGDKYTIWSRVDATELMFSTRNPFEAVEHLQDLAARTAKAEHGVLQYYDYKWYDSHHIVAAYTLPHARLLQMFATVGWYNEFDEDTYPTFNKSDYDRLTLINYDEPGVY